MLFPSHPQIDAGTLDEQLRHGFRRCLSRPPGEKELALLHRLTAEAREEYQRDPVLATKMAKTADLAALTVAANVMLNLDEMFLKR